MACALGDLAGQVVMEELPDRRKARRLEQLFEDLGLAPAGRECGRRQRGPAACGGDAVPH